MRIEILESPEAIERLSQQVEKAAGKVTRAALSLGHDLLDSLVQEIAARVQSRIKTDQQTPTGTSAESKFLSVEETAEFLRIRPSTVYLWASNGKLPHSKVGSRLLFEREALIELVKANGEHINDPEASHSQTRPQVLK